MKFLRPEYDRTFPFFNILSALLISTMMLICGSAANAQALNEGFDDLPALLANGWFTKNNSSPNNPVVPGFTQCQLGGGIAPHVGGATSCVTAGRDGGLTNTRTLSTWLLGPNRTFTNGEQISFYTRDTNSSFFSNRLQVRLSTSGASTDVGTTATDVGAFTTLLLDINPTYASTGSAGGYPGVWTQFTLTISGLAGPISGRFAFRFFVVDDFGGGNPSSIAIDSLGYPTAYLPPPSPSPTPANQQHVLDFNGDGMTDYAVVRNTGGGPMGQITWFIQNNGGTNRQVPWGLNGDRYVPADFDGDNASDIAVWRGGPPFGAFFYILRSSTGTVDQIAFGQTGDNPTVTRDYTGDGKADPAVYRSGQQSGQASTWFFRPSDGPFAGQVIGTVWGQNGDFPAPGDFNGDGKADFTVQRNNGTGNGAFLRRNGTGGPDAGGGVSSSIVFGNASDRIVPGDYDGDGSTDIAVVRGQAGTWVWYILNSSTGATTVTQWGLSATDFITAGDYDGDGKTDLGVWRPNANPAQNFFFVLRSGGGGPLAFEWGSSGDYPIANYDVQ